MDSGSIRRTRQERGGQNGSGSSEQSRRRSTRPMPSATTTGLCRTTRRSIPTSTATEPWTTHAR
eukprot:2339679-Pyramimonas_sp.AAC.1